MSQARNHASPLSSDAGVLKTLALAALGLWFIGQPAPASDFRITILDRLGNIGWTNAFPSGVCTVEATSGFGSTGASWQREQNYFTTNSVGQGELLPASTNHFF